MTIQLLKNKNEKYDGWVNAGNHSIDYIDYFPCAFARKLPDEKKDEYGNHCYEIRVSETENGKQAEVVKKRLTPTAEQIARRKKQLFRQNYSYDRDDEVALMKDAINALQVGKEIPMDYTQMELDRAAAKREADDEIEADLRKIQEQEDPTKREA
jgi:hypothetical protein